MEISFSHTGNEGCFGQEEPGVPCRPQWPMPVDVGIQSSQSADLECYQFTPAAVGQDKNKSLDLSQAKASPYDDNDVVDSDEDDVNGSDAGEDDEDEERIGQYGP